MEKSNMSAKSNREKSRQLGMPFATATHRLRKNVLFHLIQKCGMDKCFQCGKAIESVDNLSMEHKEPWMHTDNPVDLYFDIENIAFSHHTCNSGARREPPKQTTTPR